MCDLIKIFIVQILEKGTVEEGQQQANMRNKHTRINNITNSVCLLAHHGKPSQLDNHASNEGEISFLLVPGIRNT